MELLKLGSMQGRLIQPPHGQLQWFPSGYWEHEFAMARSIGLSFLELISESEYNPHNPLWSEEGRARIRELALRYRLEMISVVDNYVVSHSFDDKSVFESCHQLLAAASELGIKRYLIPLMEANELTPENLKQMVGHVRAICKMAQPYDIKVGIESSQQVPCLVEFFEQLDSPHAFYLFDTGNLINGHKDICDTLTKMARYVDHVHLKDRDDHDQNVVLGRGRVDFLKVMERLKSIDYHGPMTFETARGRDPIATAKYQVNLVTYFAREAGYDC